MGGVDAFGKWFVINDYSPVQVIAVRGWMITLVMLIWALGSGRRRELTTQRPMAHGVRIALSICGPLFMFTALASLPLADVTVVILGSPFVTAALAVPLFSERVGRHRWLAIAAGFIGVTVAMRPGSEMFRPEILFAAAAGISFAAINLTARWLRDTETTFQLVFFLMAGIALVASLALPFVWRPMSLAELAMFTCMAAATLFGYIFMTRAFMVAPLCVVAPFEYTVMIWAVTWGFVIWGDMPSAYVWTGAAIIVASGLYLLHREARLQKLSTENRSGRTFVKPSPDDDQRYFRIQFDQPGDAARQFAFHLLFGFGDCLGHFRPQSIARGDTDIARQGSVPGLVPDLAARSGAAH